MIRRRPILLSIFMSVLLGCGQTPEPDGRGEQVGYRSGTADDGYRSNGERGNVQITEIHWAGSVRGQGDDAIYDPDDVFVELLNKHPRPVHLTGWLLTIEAGHHTDGLRHASSRRWRSEVTYVIPPRLNGAPIEPNERVVLAAKPNGAFRNADYYVEGFAIPRGPFELTLQDLDERLIDHVGDSRKLPFAGAWDGFTARSMERTQLIFNNRGNRDSAWHSYSLNDFDENLSYYSGTARAGDDDSALIPLKDWHDVASPISLRARVHPEYGPRTFATPGLPNTPDYSGIVSAGDYE
ncbi:MAG: hypothetical protein VX589_12200 [Myxococcota bacterium]|nr:hypothetical protein [Myxococcota bacterium]